MRFEVASVKQNVSLRDESRIDDQIPDRFVATNVPARFLILYAYHLLDHQLVGARDWTFDKSFDVIGIYPPDKPRPDRSEIRSMLQNLLVDRFALKLHRAKRELPAYDLVIARKDGRLGPQLHKSDMNCAAQVANKRPKNDTALQSAVSSLGKIPVCSMIATRNYLAGGTRTMKDLAVTLQSLLRRPVVDRTSLQGVYDFNLRYAPTDLKVSDTTNTTMSAAPSLFTALRTQLGLKLVSRREPFEVYVVDRISVPGPN